MVYRELREMLDVDNVFRDSRKGMHWEKKVKTS